jgi:hypothetical protein
MENMSIGQHIKIGGEKKNQYGEKQEFSKKLKTLLQKIGLFDWRI